MRSVDRPWAGFSAEQVCGNAISKSLMGSFEVVGPAELFQGILSFIWVTVLMQTGFFIPYRPDEPSDHPEG